VIEAAGDEAQLRDDVLDLLEEDARGASLLDRQLAQLAGAVLDETMPAIRKIGRYRILRVLGEGGMGVVLLGEHEELHNRVAIKLLRDSTLSPARRGRFVREQQTLARLNHPSIARLYEADTLPDGTPYFVMEYVEGIPLTDYCQAQGCSARERLRLFRSICEAVHYSHQHAIIHRDLKPSNILVTKQNADGAPIVKLLDFGIAKHRDGVEDRAGQTATGLRLMTPAYAAPEQLVGGPVGLYTDVYALGLILHELLCERPVFDRQGRTPGQVEAQMLEDEPERPSSIAARLPATSGPRSLSRREWADLDVLCLVAMHREPERRYPSVEALVRDVDHFLEHEPLEARPDALSYRAGKYLRRNARYVSLAAAVASILLGTVAFYTVQLRQERNRAQVEAAKAQQVGEYLIGLFEAGDPFGGGAGEMDLPTLLDNGVERARRLDAQPLVQSQMLDVLGRVYSRLSDYERAEELLLRALETRHSRNRREPRQTLLADGTARQRRAIAP
jgi:serine/threonine-protein kinase